MNTKFKLDRAGFPMVWVNEISAYVHWIPVTKIQFEIFICESPSKDFNDPWYTEKILPLNPRVSPKNITKKNYWNAFMTGLKPFEAESYANWCSDDGHQYEIPSLDDWNLIYKTTSKMNPQNELFPEINLLPRKELLLTKLNETIQSIYKTPGHSYSLADQMFMRYGVMEWVQHEARGHEWGGMGQPNPDLQSTLRRVDSGTPEIPKNIEEQRFHYYGFRLIRR